MSLAWPAVEGATGYVVKRSLFVQGPFAPIATVPGCAHLDAGLTNGTPVHYVVSAANAGGEAADSPPVTTTPVAPPAAPSGLSAAPAHHEVKLTWVASPRASNYVVRRSETPGGPYAAVATAVGPAHTDGPLENGRSYYYVVTAVNAGGESAPSDEVAATPIEPPAAPAGFAATSGNNQVLLAWAAVPGASYYQIKRALDKRGPYTTLANVSRVNYVDNSVENGTTYYYVVHSVNAGGRSAHSARVSALPVPPPPAPGHVVAIAGNFRVSLTWEPVATATGYSVKRSTQPGGPYATVARVPQTSFVDAAVANATTYYYVVRSGTGVVKGPFSAEVQATPMSTPAAPSGLTARPGLGTVSLSWAPSPGASCYRVKRADSERGPFEIVGSPEGTTWEDIGLAHGTTFYYRVSAESPGGESADSPAVGAAAVAPPGVPTKLEALPANGEVTLAWAPVAGTSRYRVKRASNPEGPWKIIAEPTQPRHLDPGLKNGTTYHYVVSAMNAHGESLDSFPAPATPVEPPALPTGLIAIPGHAKIDLAWTPVPTAARYRVQRSAAAGGPYVLVASPRDASYTDCPLTNGIPQFYVVSAVNAGGESPTCLEVSTAPISSVGEEKAARPAPPPPKKADDDVPTLESIPMPSAQQIQGIDFERLLDLRRVEQLRALFEDTAQTFDDWEILTLIAEDGYEIRKSVETLLRLKNQGDEDVFLSGAMALFDKILKIRAQYASFVRKLRELLTNLDVPAPSRDVLEIAIGFILQASRGRTRAEQWVADPVAHRKAAGEYMKMAYAIARKYRDAL